MMVFCPFDLCASSLSTPTCSGDCGGVGSESKEGFSVKASAK